MELKHFVAAREGNIKTQPFPDIDNPDKSSTFTQKGPSGNSLLHVAASFGNDAITDLLAEKFPDLITEKNFTENTPVHLAARAWHLSTVRILVDRAKNSRKKSRRGKVLQLKNCNGNTALHEALLALYDLGKQGANRDSIASEITCYLVSQDPQVCYFVNDAKMSPLCLAVVSRKISILEDILKALPESHNPLHRNRDPEDKSPVNVAIEQAKEKAENIAEMLEAFKNHKPELLRIPDGKGNTPLHCAASVGNLEVVQWLLKYNGDNALAEMNNDGHYPLHVACAYGHVEVAERLVKDCTDSCEWLTKDGWNILHVAANSGKQDMVKWILTQRDWAKKLINGVDKYGNTPMHLAARRGHSLVVGFLLWEGQGQLEFLNLKNKEQQTAYQIADEEAGKEDKRSQNKDQVQPAEDVSVGGSLLPEKMMTASVLFAAQCYYDFYSASGRIWQNVLMTMKPPQLADVKDRINGLLVVATLIVAAAFGASHQMPQMPDTSNTPSLQDDEQLGNALETFMGYDIVAMYVSILAAIILCWAQLIDVNLASLVVVFASILVAVALYMMCVSFMSAVVIGMHDHPNFIKISTKLTNVIYLALLTIVSSPLLITFRWKEVVLRIVYLVLFCFWFAIYNYVYPPIRSCWRTGRDSVRRTRRTSEYGSSSGQETV